MSITYKQHYSLEIYLTVDKLHQDLGQNKNIAKNFDNTNKKNRILEHQFFRVLEFNVYNLLVR